MKHLLTLILLTASLALAQPVQQQGYDFSAPIPQGATNIRAGVSGNVSTRTYSYWVITIFPRGSSVPAGPALVQNAPQTLSASDKIAISWNAAPGATSYVVVRGNNAANPLAGGSCAACLVASGLSGTSTEDAGAALSSYTLGSSIPVATGRLELNNRDYTNPLFQFSNYWNWQPVGAGALATRPSTCTANRDVFVCNGTACDPNPRIDFCTSTNTWTTLSASTGSCVSVTGDDDYQCTVSGTVVLLDADTANTGAATLNGDPIYWPRDGEDPPDNAIRADNTALLVRCDTCTATAWILQENANSLGALETLSGTLDISAQSNLGTTNAGGVCVVTGDNINCKSTYMADPCIFTNPVTGHSDVCQLKFPQAVTITRIHCNTTTATSTADIEFEERAEATPNTAGTEVMGADLQCTTTGATDTTFDNAGIAANAPMSLKITAVANAPTVLRVYVEYSYQ